MLGEYASPNKIRHLNLRVVDCIDWPIIELTVMEIDRCLQSRFVLGSWGASDRQTSDEMHLFHDPFWSYSIDLRWSTSIPVPDVHLLHH